jgi:hypothetical protein
MPGMTRLLKCTGHGITDVTDLEKAARAIMRSDRQVQDRRQDPQALKELEAT